MFIGHHPFTKDKGTRFYDEWYHYLKGEGISFLKVDQQCVIPRIAKGHIELNQLPYWEIAENLQSHLQQSVNQYFDRNIINCMDMSLEATYNFGDAAIARNSDRFFPNTNSLF